MRRFWSVVLLCVLSLTAIAQDRVRFVRPPVAFPLSAHASNRYLVEANGTPFTVLGHNAWSIIGLSRADTAWFLGDTVSKAFNAVEVWIPGRYATSVNVPRDGENNLPFEDELDGSAWNGSLSYANINTDAPDFTTPNEAYWAFVDRFFADCERFGLAVFFFPAYVGFPTTPIEGWMDEMVANGTTKMETYGSWVANRYRNQKNLIWMIGGDRGGGSEQFTAEQEDAEQALLDGLFSVLPQPQTLVSAEWRRGSITTDQPVFGGYITLNGTYSNATDINNQGARAWAYSPTLPAFVQETPFEGQSGEPYRRYGWWGWLSVIGGDFSMGHATQFLFNSGWQNDMHSTMAMDMARRNRFVTSYPWHTLEPRPSMVNAGGGTLTAADYVACVSDDAGTLAWCYIPTADDGSVTINRNVMSAAFRARWFDPTDETYTAIGTGISNSGTQAFTVPGNNAEGAFDDWVLVFDIP